MTVQNPYSSPISTDPQPTDSSDQPAALGAIARTTFLAWEKLRLIYVAALAVVSLLITLFEPSILSSLDYWFTIIGGAIVANICFLAGPILDTYIAWLGFPTKLFRLTLFLIGTLFACGLAAWAILQEIFYFELTGFSLG